MFSKYLAALLATSGFASPVFADEHAHGDAAVAQAVIREIAAEDRAYIAAHNVSFFQELSKGQRPRATVVTCSDSRVHTNMLEKTPEGDLFMVRDIGNQLATARGSVEYGVNHLASSLLIFIGHSGCGAIKAASGDYAALEPDIRKELDTINIAKGGANIDGVKTNVNNQVAAAMEEFADKVKAGELLVVGAVYDFADDMKQGAGMLNIINVNGETDSARIKTALTATPTYMAHAQH